jgi:hypothetical protein
LHEGLGSVTWGLTGNRQETWEAMTRYVRQVADHFFISTALLRKKVNR